MSKTISRWMAAVVTLLLAIGIGYGIYHVFLQSRRAPAIHRAVISTVDEGVDLVGLVVRDETVLYKEPGRSYVPLIASGERVSASAVLGVSFASPTDAEAYRQIRALEAKAAGLSGAAGQGTALDIVAYNRQIKTQTEVLAAQVQAGVFTSLATQREALEKSMALRAMAVSEEANGNEALLVELNSEKARLSASLSDVGQRLFSQSAGYFCRYVDGREQLFSPEQVLAMTPEAFVKAKAFPAATVSGDEVLGKLIGGHGWYFAALISESEKAFLELGREYTLALAGTRVSAALQSVSAGESDDSLAVFYSRVPLPDVTLYREQPCRVVLDSYEGVKIPAEALRLQNGAPGVFVLEGARAVFKQVDILFTGDHYYLVSVGAENRKSLFINDRIIVGEKDLYDGKVIS